MLTGLAQQAHRVRFLLNDNSTTLLTAAGVAGTTVTAYLTGRASFKAADIIREEQNLARTELKVRDQTEGIEGWEKKDMTIPASELTTFDKLGLTWKLYLPPVGAGVLTITCIITANRISSKKIAALALASGISERAFQEYKDKVVEKLGVRQDQKIRDDVAQDRVSTNTSNSREIIVAGTGQVLCYDMLTGRYFQSTMEDIKRAENKVNYELIHYMSASLSTFYDEIGLPPTDYTDTVGWNTHHNMEVQFSTVMSQDQRPCLAISFSRPPIANYDKNWD